MLLKQLWKTLLLCASILVVGALFAEPKAEHDFSDADRSYWAFQPVAEVAPPAAEEPHPVDAFLNAKLAKKGLSRKRLRRPYRAGDLRDDGPDRRAGAGPDAALRRLDQRRARAHP